MVLKLPGNLIANLKRKLSNSAEEEFHCATLFLELRFRGVGVNILPPLNFKIVRNYFCDFKITLKGISSSLSHCSSLSLSQSLSKTRVKTTTTIVDNDSPGLLIIHGEDEPCSDVARSVSFDTNEINADIRNLHSPFSL